MVEKKPPRMRAACGQCHAAKVKCSGEKTGCTRCTKLGLECEYGISMVGRASKKKGDNENGDVTMGEGSGDDSGLPVLDSNPADSFTLPGVDGDGLDFNFAPQDFLSITGLNDFSFHAFPDNMPSDMSSLPGLSTGASSAASQDGSSPSATANPRQASKSHMHPSHLPDFGREQQKPETMPKTPLDAHEAAARASLITEPLSLSTAEASRISATESYEPLFCLARLVYYLENQLESSGKQSLDKTLSVVKSALRELMETVKWDGCMASYGCRALVFAVLTLIVKLYSQALARFRAGYKGPPDAYMTLGSFEVDPEDQWRLQNMMIASELGRCVQVIKIMAKEQTSRCERGNECGGVKNFECLAETATQMKTTLERESVHDKRMVHPLI